MRLDKFLSKALNLSRNEVLPIIRNRQITVNNQVIIQKDFHLSEEKDIVCFNHEPLTYRAFAYYMLNKPAGVVSAVSDPRDSTVLDLIHERKDVFPIGRLDKDSEGLLILSNNGTLTHRLTNPNHDIVKKYFVQVLNVLDPSLITLFASGLDIYDGNKKLFHTKPATLEIIDSTTCYVSITEGKYHQIKKMFKKCGNEVVYLKRIAMGTLPLDPSLNPGEYRRLRDDEIALLLQIAQLKH